MTDWPAHDIKQQITSVLLRSHDYERSIEGLEWSVGNNGVTRIEAICKPGEYTYVPYIRVWQGDRAVAEFIQHQAVCVFYGDP